MTTAVATCGTSFGVDHIKVLRRVLGDDSGLGEVVFTFDPDAAGQKAAMRAFSEERRFAAQTYVAVGPEGLDPCDLRLTRGDDAVRRMIQGKKPMFEFAIKQILADHDLDTVEGRVAALRAAAPVVADIRDPSLRPGYARELAGWLGMDLTEVGRAVQTAGRSMPADGADRSGGSPQGRHAQGGHGPEDEGGDASRSMSLMDLPTDLATRLERDALMAMLQHPELVGNDLVMRAAQVTFVNESLAVVRDGVIGSMDALGGADWLSRVALEVPESFATLVKQLGVAPLPNRGDADKLAVYVKGVTAELVGRDLLRRKADLIGRLQRTDATHDRERYQEIQRELMQVEAERRALRE